MGQNTGVRGYPRFGGIWTNDVYSWEGCSALCQMRSDCNYWTWHRGNSGAWAYKCVTMIDAGGKSYDNNAVSGERSCKRGTTTAKLLWLKNLALQPLYNYKSS